MPNPDEIQPFAERKTIAAFSSASDAGDPHTTDSDGVPLPEFDLDGFLPYQLSKLANRVSRALERRYSSVHGLAVPEWRIMLHLSQSNLIGMNELNSRIEMHKSRVSRAAERLERAGLVRRSVNEMDRRMVNLELTESGRLLLCDLLPLARQFQTELAAVLGENQEALRTGIDALMEKCAE